MLGHALLGIVLDLAYAEVDLIADEGHAVEDNERNEQGDKLSAIWIRNRKTMVLETVFILWHEAWMLAG